MGRKCELYAVEQGQTRRKMIDILNLDAENGTTLYELDHDVIKQQDIMQLLPEVYQWFTVRNADHVRYPEKANRPWLSLLRFVLKPKYNIIRKDYRLRVDKDLVRTQRYFFEKGPRSLSAK
eukprot:NODE_432_length_8732_cov_0.302907.p7 type:complete len:121 gc:universal NODE_432_length_8732_cov_0.302907:1106-744(-)